jgi:hypothetical protein
LARPLAKAREGENVDAMAMKLLKALKDLLEEPAEYTRRAAREVIAEAERDLRAIREEQAVLALIQPQKPQEPSFQSGENPEPIL